MLFFRSWFSLRFGEIPNCFFVLIPPRWPRFPVFFTCTLLWILHCFNIVVFQLRSLNWPHSQKCLRMCTVPETVQINKERRKRRVLWSLYEPWDKPEDSPQNQTQWERKIQREGTSDLFVSRNNTKTFQINAVTMIGTVPKHSVAPYTVAGTFFVGLRALRFTACLYSQTHNRFEAKLWTHWCGLY